MLDDGFSISFGNVSIDWQVRFQPVCCVDLIDGWFGWKHKNLKDDHILGVVQGAGEEHFGPVNIRNKVVAPRDAEIVIVIVEYVKHSGPQDAENTRIMLFSLTDNDDNLFQFSQDMS